ncbi:MAG TPA: hypothetical protein PKZ83_11325 [bacterium]|nr:hypothetical protein [bacterium]HQJ65274.1 hypothetical protein [bacterium]
MNKYSTPFAALWMISAAVICFEIVATRISSVIFVNNHAAIILSLAILGLAMGGVFSHYRFKSIDLSDMHRIICRTTFGLGLSLLVFIVAIIRLSITDRIIYLILLFVPFFLGGIVYSQLFKFWAEYSFRLYAFDLFGAAAGSISAIFLLNYLGASNSVFFLCILIVSAGVLLSYRQIKKVLLFGLGVLLCFSAGWLILLRDADLLGPIPIGRFPEKDFYQVYPDAARTSHIMDSRWSIYGRADLVEYDDQDMVRQLFIDGAAGTQMYRFSGDVRNPDILLQNLLITQTGAIPFLFLTNDERNNMLVIGPGGGKEVLLGLLSGVEQITGVEINPDFVGIVKSHRDFNGGLYTDFPNIRIDVAEGRHYVKNCSRRYDLLVMALPSTEQLQNIDNFAVSENFLLTVEALQDYWNILTPEGRLIITVHNRWELARLLITALEAFRQQGFPIEELLNHVLIWEQDFAPTVVIRKNGFTEEQVEQMEKLQSQLPAYLPRITYFPHRLLQATDTPVNALLKQVSPNVEGLRNYLRHCPYDVSPCLDDRPYFYKIRKGIPAEYLGLLACLVFINLCIIAIPFYNLRKRSPQKTMQDLGLALLVVSCTGLGFMIVEVALFQKLILYLGSPTIALSLLLGSLLIGMGCGSYLGKRLLSDDRHKGMRIVSLLIVVSGGIVYLCCPLVLRSLMGYHQLLRSTLCFAMIAPLGFFLGIPFPGAIQILKDDFSAQIPWMYGVNGAMSVLGSILALVISMVFGFTAAFALGLFFYSIIFFFLLTLRS